MNITVGGGVSEEELGGSEESIRVCPVSQAPTERPVAKRRDACRKSLQ